MFSTGTDRDVRTDGTNFHLTAHILLPVCMDNKKKKTIPSSAVPVSSIHFNDFNYNL